MKRSIDVTEFLAAKAEDDCDFRNRLLAKPRETIEAELGVTLAKEHEIHVHEESYAKTHLVLPPRSKLTKAEKEAAKHGATSLEFLRKTMHDPAPPVRPAEPGGKRGRKGRAGGGSLAGAGRESIRKGLTFLESAIDDNGAWRCIRFNVGDPDIPRHFERPPFVSALCVLALECSGEALAQAICSATRTYLADTIEYPGLWRYYRHLPQDLDSTSLCSLVVGAHPWIALGRNIPPVLANRDEDGRFMTWVLADGEPDVVSRFRIEADPVVNANVIAYLGDHPATRNAQRWLEALIVEGRLEGSSKWYPDTVSIYYAVARALNLARPALERLRPMLADRVLGLRDENGDFGNVLQTAQAVSTLHRIGALDRIDTGRRVEELMDSQHEDGSWPELLAFGDQTLKWGAIGQIGHGAESLTAAFCIEALEHLVETMQP
ncbi:MAG: hypothetical protein F4145_03825 [Boseongicola sp. SB0675_bin_26]|nr:hypothetical protein [Boseongicola sp. SB0675_bin_26]